MPELPEVQTTTTLLNKLVAGKKIAEVISTYKSAYYTGKENIKDPKYFAKFKKAVIGKKILKVYRRAKNVLIDITGGQTILVHMKMTGHFLYENYKDDPFNRHIRLTFKFSDGTSLYFSDARKFATFTLIPDEIAFRGKFEKVGPEPLDDKFNLAVLKSRLLLRPNMKIKTALMDQELIAGIGNIYSDEILWASGISPLRKVSQIKDLEFPLILKNIKKILSAGIKFGGDSMSDYRNPYGERGNFQYHHKVYQKAGEKCSKKGCGGIIKRIVVGARSAHFCPVHQK